MARPIRPVTARCRHLGLGLYATNRVRVLLRYADGNRAMTVSMATMLGYSRTAEFGPIYLHVFGYRLAGPVEWQTFGKLCGLVPAAEPMPPLEANLYLELWTVSEERFLQEAHTLQTLHQPIPAICSCGLSFMQQPPEWMN